MSEIRTNPARSAVQVGEGTHPLGEDTHPLGDVTQRLTPINACDRKRRAPPDPAGRRTRRRPSFV
jgi:hypothetical protein